MSYQKIVLKILICGDFYVGKTSIIKRYVNDFFNPHYKLTLGVDYCEKNVEAENGVKVVLQLWDIAGNERFGHMTSVYYKNSVGAIIVFDVDRVETLETSLKWKDDISQRIGNGSVFPFLLLANKCDLPTAHINHEELSQFADDNGFIGWFSTSAKDNVNINESMQTLVNYIVKTPQLMESIAHHESDSATNIDLEDTMSSTSSQFIVHKPSSSSSPAGRMDVSLNGGDDEKGGCC